MAQPGTIYLQKRNYEQTPKVNKMKNMLTGYRILDITQFVAGPTCSRLMAEMGADVIKVELAPNGDHARRSGLKPRQQEHKNSSQSTYFGQHNHSKRSIAINLKTEKGLSLLKKLPP